MLESPEPKKGGGWATCGPFYNAGQDIQPIIQAIRWDCSKYFATLNFFSRTRASVTQRWRVSWQGFFVLRISCFILKNNCPLILGHLPFLLCHQSGVSPIPDCFHLCHPSSCVYSPHLPLSLLLVLRIPPAHDHSPWFKPSYHLYSRFLYFLLKKSDFFFPALFWSCLLFGFPPLGAFSVFLSFFCSVFPSLWSVFCSYCVGCSAV